MTSRTSASAIALSLQAVFCAHASSNQADEETTTLQGIQVTGSHIRRSEFETAQPLLVLDRIRLQRTGLSSLGEILQQLPQHVSDLNTDFNNGGNGETRIDLRNLGAKRTLVLLNGNRYVSALDGAVDVGSIPLAIVERVEVLADGASAVYGSDAIGGVVNIITRGDYDGAEAGAKYAASEHGDGERRSADVTWGRHGDRGGFAINLSFADQRPIWAGDRAISAVPVFGLPANDIQAGASPTTPYGRFGFGPGGNRLPDGTVGQLTWDPDSTSHRRFDPRRDGFNFAPHNYLRTPYERASLFTQARSGIANGIDLRGELLLQRHRSSGELAPTPIVQYGGGGGVHQSSIDSDNLYNPFGQPVTLFTFRPLNRPRRFERDTTTQYLSIGLDGASGIGARTIDWRLNLIDARQHQDVWITGGYDLHRLALGVGPSFLDATGTPRCGRASAPLADCVPLDFLHGRNGFSDAMFDAITVQAGSRVDRRLRSATAAASGELLNLPAGPVTMATGLEWREERGAVDMDALLADDAIDFGGLAPEPISGRVAVREAWLEFDLPLLSTRPGVRTLSLSLATRFSDYSTFGGTSNGKLALAWRPRAGLLLRAAWSRGFRAPSTDELFALSGTLQPSALAVAFLDPCVAPPDAATAARCRADGVPAEGFDPQMAPRIRVGSNPGLQPERARNRSLGLAWSPAAIDSLDLTLDWWRIELRDTIDSILAPELPHLCYVQGIAGACAQLQRDRTTGVLTLIDARLYNYGVYEIEGFDLAVSYRWSGRTGDFRLRWDSVYLARHLRELPADAPPVSLVGNYHQWDPGWRLRSLLSLDWHYRQAGATLSLRYYPALDESCELPAWAGRPDLCTRPDVRSPVFGGAPEHVVRERTYVDLQLRWEPRAGRQFSFGVDNIFNRDPPVSYNAPNSYDPSYDIPGRFWHAGYRHRF